MPITKTIEESRTYTVTLMTLAEYADAILPEQYKQPLKTISEALDVHGWKPDPFPEEYKPVCCGQETTCSSFLGSCYSAMCKTCGRFVLDVTGPTFGNSWVSIPDTEKVDLETDYEHRWIAGVSHI